jgi:hypothetical protein
MMLRNHGLLTVGETWGKRSCACTTGKSLRDQLAAQAAGIGVAAGCGVRAYRAAVQ